MTWKNLQLWLLQISLFVAAFMWSGCDWDPVRDNPLDPNSKGYRPIPAQGSIDVQVMTLFSNQPIQNAKVELLAEPVLSRQTDANGWARFTEVAAGTLMVQATTLSGSTPSYAPESKQVVIRNATRNETTLFLDALPSFIYAEAHSVTSQLYFDSLLYEYEVHLKARVTDPDGGGDIRRVEWSWVDTTSQQSLDGLLFYSGPDSLYHDTLIPGKSFGNIDAALDGVFRYEVFDGQDNSVKSDPLRLVRVIHDVPTLTDRSGQIYIGDQKLEWSFSFSDDFVSIDQFNYLLRINKIVQSYPMVYDSLITPVGRSIIHRFGNIFELGQYDYFVWVVDLHGNRARSVPGTFYITD